MIEPRNAFEAFRDCAADLFEAHIATAWRPRAGSRMSHRNLTAAEIVPLMPKGAKIAFAGGVDCNDQRAIWDALDRVLAEHPDMVLMHGGASEGAEFVASRWADARRVTQMLFRPD